VETLNEIKPISENEEHRMTNEMDAMLLENEEEI